jgi:hypothetical protein
MSDFELLDAFMSHGAVSLTFFTAFISATSAFVVVAYLAGKNLPSSVANITVAIYSVASIYFVSSFQRLTTSLIAIRDQMSDTLAWHPAVSEAEWVLHGLAWSGFIATGILYFSAIWYFYHVRMKIHDAT